MLKALIDGAIADCVTIDDRGLQYGHGVFETLAVVGGTPLLWAAHYRRLQEACARLGFGAPSEALLQEDIQRLGIDAERAVLKIIVTAGSGGRGYRAPPVLAPRRIVSLWPWPTHAARHAEDGIALYLCKTPAWSHPILAGIKHLNCLDRVLARAEWGDDYAEGLMCDAHGELVSGTMSNVFLVRAGQLQTPVLVAAGVRGIMRAEVLKIAARLGLSISETSLRLGDVVGADAIFVTNSVIGIWPVVQFQERSYSIGETTRSLQAEIARHRATDRR